MIFASLPFCATKNQQSMTHFVAELGTNAELEYRVLSTTPISNPPIFSIDVSTGVISTETELDRESEEQYELTIQVKNEETRK